MAAAVSQSIASSAVSPDAKRCRLCTVLLNGQSQSASAAALGTCDDCARRPEARRTPGSASLVAAGGSPTRGFTVADKSLIKRVHGFMPAQTLLDLLNERLRADMPKARPYTMQQLHEEIRVVAGPEPTDDWAGLRKVLAHARRSGVLAQITPQVVEDFAVVFSLTPAQAMRLKDTVLSAAEEARQGEKA